MISRTVPNRSSAAPPPKSGEFSVARSGEFHLAINTGERNACRTLVALLVLAHERTCEGELAEVLDTEMQAGRLPDLKGLQARFGPKTATAPHVAIQLGTLAAYDEILSWRPPPANDLIAALATEVVA